MSPFLLPRSRLCPSEWHSWALLLSVLQCGPRPAFVWLFILGILRARAVQMPAPSSAVSSPSDTSVCFAISASPLRKRNVGALLPWAVFTSHVLERTPCRFVAMLPILHSKRGASPHPRVLGDPLPCARTVLYSWGGVLWGEGKWVGSFVRNCQAPLWRVVPVLTRRW